MPRLAPVTLLFFVLGACGGGAQTARPDATARAYAEALRRGDADAIYALLDEETRAHVDLEALRAQLADAREELADQAAALDRVIAAGDAFATGATVPHSRQSETHLVVEGEEWKIAGPFLDAASLATPVDAVRALRSVLARRGLGGTARVFARAPRAEVEDEIAQFLEDTEDELDYDVEIDGNDATVRTSTGRRIRLVREAGEWHVLSVE